MVDTLGMVLNCFVSAANVADVKAASALLAPVLEDLVKTILDFRFWILDFPLLERRGLQIAR